MRQRAPSAHERRSLAHRQIASRESKGYWEIQTPKSVHVESSTILDPIDDEHLQAHLYQNGASVESVERCRSIHDTNKAQQQQDKPRLENFHTLFRTPHHVPDNNYRNYLLGKTARRKRDAPIFTRSCMTGTCAGFSVVAVLFLLFVGFLIDTQPLYIKGTLTHRVILQEGNKKAVVQYLLPDGSTRLSSAVTAYQAATAYLFTLFLCGYIAYPGWFQAQLYRRSQNYQDIPDHASEADSTVPMFHSSDEAGTNSKMAYHPTHWRRLSIWLKQWLAARGWYTPIHKFRRKNTQKTG